MLGVLLMSSIKYFDIVAASDDPRTSMMTRLANLEKFMAAWPAEFAPPMM
jgi:hypothetical protein